MKILKFGVLAGAATCLLLSVYTRDCHAAVALAQYPFTSSSAASTDTDGSSTASTFSDGDGTLNFDTNFGNPLPSVFKSYNDAANSKAAALAGNSYWQFTVTPVAGNNLNLSSITIDIENDKVTGDGANPDATFFLQASLDGGAFADVPLGSFSPPPGNKSAWATDVSSYANIANTGVTFRIYAFDSEGSTGTKFDTLGLHLDNVELDGTTTDPPPSAPEATSLAIWSVLGLVAGGINWRRQRLA